MSAKTRYDDGYRDGYAKATEDFKEKVKRIFAETWGLKP